MSSTFIKYNIFVSLLMTQCRISRLVIDILVEGEALITHRKHAQLDVFHLKVAGEQEQNA